jgi:imidazolonepropionase-like amidohydrolase
MEIAWDKFKPGMLADIIVLAKNPLDDIYGCF